MKINIISLGCPKNLTDTEVLLGKFQSLGYQITNNLRSADIIIVNTCAFLKSARDEAIETIKKVNEQKKDGQKIYIAGCLPKVASQLPKVDGIIDSIDLFDHKIPRVKATPPWTAYVKIADGCDNRCSYCLVPKIRGRFRSRKIEDILAEVKLLVEKGVKEIILVAQDTTMYGIDIYGKSMLSKLLKKLAKIDGLEWVRVMYTHPAHLTNDVIEIIATEDKICKYIDLPIQHICDRILGLMRRRVIRRDIEVLIEKLRSIKNLAIRTSLIVGFPTETKEEFRELLDFIEGVRFERLGVFKYSREVGTPAYNLRGQVPEGEKVSRFRQVMLIQRKISKEFSKNMVGRSLKVLVEKKGVGRSYMDAPEIDGSVITNNPKVTPGEFVNVKITGSKIYDLVGEISP